jgi:hypothetical protein
MPQIPTPRKRYIHSIIDAVEVDDKAIRILGSKDILQAAIAGNVRGFVRKWRAIQNKTVDRRGVRTPTGALSY